MSVLNLGGRRRSVKLNRDTMGIDGFADYEIDRIKNYCDQARKFDRAPAVVIAGGRVRLVCDTIARGVKIVKPEHYLTSLIWRPDLTVEFGGCDYSEL